MIINFKKLWP